MDLCCGGGTNTICIAENGFEVIGIYVSRAALEYAWAKAAQAHVPVNFVRQSFVGVAFGDIVFDFVLDMSCFHYVVLNDRHRFITRGYLVLKESGDHLLTCFSYKNMSAWNHFTEKQIVSLFSGFFCKKGYVAFLFC